VLIDLRRSLATLISNKGRKGIGKKYDTSYEWPVSRVQLVLLHTKAISAAATILTTVSQIELGSKGG